MATSVSAATQPAAQPSAQPGDPQAARRQALHDQLTRAEQAMLAKRFGEAAGICQDVLEQAPDLPHALALLGAVAGARGDLPRGIALLERAIAKQPEIAAWHSNLSGFCRLLNRLEEAEARAREAVRLQPDSVRFLLSLGKALMDLGKRDEAVPVFLAALAREENNPEAHLAIGQILLARGEMKPGWVEYEWRNRLEQAKGMLPRMVAPAWNGMRMPHDRILLVGDQGYGDTLQFARFIPAVAARCREVVVGCSPDLLPLLRGVPGIAQIHSRWNEIPPHVAYCLLSSLPGIFGVERDTIPAPIPYLAADPARVADWARLLDENLGSGRRRIGIAWAGRPTHPNDRRRSLRLAELAPLAAVEDVAFVSLQKAVLRRDAEALGTLPGMLNVADRLGDFAETAALLANLDLVITVDTAVGHLAGALGRPVWLMLATPSDWRWLLDRADSPWYPSMRLFRQNRPGDWASVVGPVTAALAELARGAATPAHRKPARTTVRVPSTSPA